jgi:short subunit dehydrogenase-like uncharacterized protein
MDLFLLYGSYGYTGRLIAEWAVKEGLHPILAGRNESQLNRQAKQLGLACRAFSLDDHAALEDALKEVEVVLHCAGPFGNTFRSMAEACLRTKRHYVDISGEIDSFEALAALDLQAKQSGVMLLPGAGFDVVASDCLSAYLAKKLPTATHLRLFIRSVRGGISRGTARSSIEKLDKQGRIRRNGAIVDVPPAWRLERMDFGRGPVRVVSIGWGDVSTAYHSTGIPNVETYMALPPALIHVMYASRMLGPLLSARLLKEMLKWLAGVILPPGPSPERNETGFSLMIGEVTDGKKTYRARLRTPAGYWLTALTSVEIMKRILASDFKPGFQTPARVYGPDFIMQFPRVEREDL